MRNSERALWLRCRQAHHWGYTERLKPKVEAAPLRFGSLIHGALEVRYPKGIKRGPHPTRTFKKLYDAELEKSLAFGFKDADGKWEDARELGIAMLDGYVEKYGMDQNYEVLATEQTFRTPIRVKGRTIAFYVGTFDGIWKDRTKRRLVIKDYKTTKNDPTKNHHLTLDEQASTYMSFGTAWMVQQGLLKPGKFPSHMLYTFLKKQKPWSGPTNAKGQRLTATGKVAADQGGPLFHRELVYRDEYQRNYFKNRATQTISEMLTLPVYKSPGMFTCIGCQYRDICELDEDGADIGDLKKAAFTTWEPYASHELSEERDHF